MSRDGLRVAFVSPRFEPEAAGGAEVLAKALAMRLASRGWRAEVLTTCARDHVSWENHYPEGAEEREGLVVRRFRTNPWRDLERYLELQERIIGFEELSYEEEKEWVAESVASEALFRYIGERSDGYDLLVFIPYMFGTTYWGAQIDPDKSVLIPCLHDEPYAYLKVFREVFDNVRGVIFNTDAEARLGREIFNLPERRMAVVGMGMESEGSADEDGFMHKFGLRSPFVLYSGRREGGKNTDLLVEYFRAVKRYATLPWTLVFIGSGALRLQPADHGAIVDVGYVSEQDKRSAYAAASLLCQPSLNESLSIVMMEAWLAGAPVLAHARCAVTSDHVRRSGGGLLFADYHEFEAVLQFLAEQPALGKALGQRGRAYVLSHYSWEQVMGRFDAALRKFGLCGRG